MDLLHGLIPSRHGVSIIDVRMQRKMNAICDDQGNGHDARVVCLKESEAVETDG